MIRLRASFTRIDDPRPAACPLRAKGPSAVDRGDGWQSLLVGVALSWWFAHDARAENQVSRVVVYPDRAQVTRVASVSCGPRVRVRFPGIPPAADPGSLRAQVAAGGGRLDGLRSEEQPRDQAYAGKAAALDEQIHKLEGELRALSDRRRRAEDAQRVAGSYGEVAVGLIGKEMADPPNLRAWTTALDSGHQARMRAAASLADLSVRQRGLDRRAQELRTQRDQAQAAAQRHEYLAEALVSCDPGKTARVELTYLVGGAGWEPAHEARLSDSGAVEVTTYATLTQTTGEDWHAAMLTLSTAVPRSNATPPEIAPLHIWAEARTPPRKVITSREEYQPHAQAPDAPAFSPAVAGKKAVPQGLSVQFPVAAAADVSGDGQPVRVLLGKAGLRARLSYRAVPKELPHVFRVADLTNSAPYPLLAGPIDIFRRGQFLGRYDLDRVPSGGRFLLSLGLEEGLKVKRVVVEEMVRDRGLLGSTLRHRYGYRFETESYLSRPEEVELSEQVPVSELSEIKISIDPKTTPGYDLRGADGIVTFKIPLRPGEKRAVELRYHVDVPASYETGDSSSR